MSTRKPFFSKHVLIGISSTVVILILAVISFDFNDRKNIIENSEIKIGNDIRDNYLDLLITRNDSVLNIESPHKNGRTVFKSKNGNYDLKIFIEDKEIVSRKFKISECRPKHIYAFFDSENSNYYTYYNGIVSREIEKRTVNKTLSTDELRKIVIEIKQGITVADLEKIGYDVKKEKIKLYVLDEPFIID